MKLTQMLKMAALLALPMAFVAPTQAASKNAEKPQAEAVQVEAKAEQKAAENDAPVVANQVNINTASASELQRALIGIGAKKAQAIVEYRETNGKFAAAEDLLKVKGIGKNTLEKNLSRILL